MAEAFIYHQATAEYSNPFNASPPVQLLSGNVDEGASNTFFKSAEQLKQMMVASGSKKPRYDRD